ncbi:MAG: MMPL family transporter, partial [Ruminiclostridium sp.]
ITADDFVKIMVLVVVSIFIVLVILLRSLIAPIYLIFTTLLSFAATMGITYLVFQVGLGREGISWGTPFFAFCILVALGVDYNIFIMTRVKEEYIPGKVTTSISKALGSTGGIITSCGLIMAGTFGALMAAPINSQVELGFATVVGLLMDTFLIRCLLVPAIAVKFGELNWWPGKKIKIIPEAEYRAGNEEVSSDSKIIT